MASDPVISLSYNDGGIGKTLQELSRRSRDLVPPLKNAREIILLAIDQGFEQERSPDGIPWKPNSPYTTARKRAEGRILKINQLTGRMRASINGQITGDKLVVGTNVAYAAARQRVNPFLGISKEAQEEIAQEFADYLEGDL